MNLNDNIEANHCTRSRAIPVQFTPSQQISLISITLLASYPGFTPNLPIKLHTNFLLTSILLNTQPILILLI